MSEAPVHLVDDDPEARQSLALSLRVHGFESRAYRSGQSFLDRAAPPGAGCAILYLRMPRETEVLGLVAEGPTSEQIAGRLGIATRPVDLHRGALLDKMQARSTIDLLRLFSAADIDPGPDRQSEA